MLLIFGLSGRVSIQRDRQGLQSSCPNCRGDLLVGRMRNWFSLYFIPIFPINTVEELYKCSNCDETFHKSIENLIFAKDDDTEIMEEIGKQKTFACVACVSCLATSDDSLNYKEKILIKGILGEADESYREEVEGLFEEIINNKDKSKREDIAYAVLRDARDSITKNDLAHILAMSVKIVNVDNEVSEAERRCFEEIALILGLPKNVVEEELKKA